MPSPSPTCLSHSHLCLAALCILPFSTAPAQTSFGPPQTVTTVSNADSPQSVFAVDLDGDGDQNAPSTSLSFDAIVWYENLTPVPARMEVNTETKAPDAEASVVFNDTTAVGEWTLLDD